MELRPISQHDTPDLIDIAEEARAAAHEALRHVPHMRIDTTGAAVAPLTFGDRRHIQAQLGCLISEVIDHATRALTIQASLCEDASIAVRITSGTTWRELRLPIACTTALDAPALAQIERYGFLRLASPTAA